MKFWHLLQCGWTLKTHVKWNKSDTKGQALHTWNKHCLHGISETVKFIETASSMVVTTSWREGRMESYCLMSTEFQCGIVLELPDSVSPKFICWNLYFQWTGIKRWNLWEVVIRFRWGLESGAPMTKLESFEEEKEASVLSLPCEDTTQRQLSVNKEDSPHQTPHLQVPRSWTSQLHNSDK